MRDTAAGIYLHNLMENFQLWTMVNGKQDQTSDEDEKYQMQTKLYDVIIFFEFVCKVIGSHRTVGILVHFSSAQVPIACSYSYSYGNVINKNTALPMRHTDNNKHISFLLCTLLVLVASCTVSFIELRGALSAIQLYTQHIQYAPLCALHISSSSHFSLQSY